MERDIENNLQSLGSLLDLLAKEVGVGEEEGSHGNHTPSANPPTSRGSPRVAGVSRVSPRTSSSPRGASSFRKKQTSSNSTSKASRDPDNLAKEIEEMMTAISGLRQEANKASERTLRRSFRSSKKERSPYAEQEDKRSTGSPAKNGSLTGKLSSRRDLSSNSVHPTGHGYETNGDAIIGSSWSEKPTSSGRDSRNGANTHWTNNSHLADGSSNGLPRVEDVALGKEVAPNSHSTDATAKGITSKSHKYSENSDFDKRLANLLRDSLDEATFGAEVGKKVPADKPDVEDSDSDTDSSQGDKVYDITGKLCSRSLFVSKNEVVPLDTNGVSNGISSHSSELQGQGATSVPEAVCTETPLSGYVNWGRPVLSGLVEYPVQSLSECSVEDYESWLHRKYTKGEHSAMRDKAIDRITNSAEGGSLKIDGVTTGETDDSDVVSCKESSVEVVPERLAGLTQGSVLTIDGVTTDETEDNAVGSTSKDNGDQDTLVDTHGRDTKKSHDTTDETHDANVATSEPELDASTDTTEDTIIILAKEGDVTFLAKDEENQSIPVLDHNHNVGKSAFSESSSPILLPLGANTPQDEPTSNQSIEGGESSPSLEQSSTSALSPSSAALPSTDHAVSVITCEDYRTTEPQSKKIEKPDMSLNQAVSDGLNTRQSEICVRHDADTGEPDVCERDGVAETHGELNHSHNHEADDEDEEEDADEFSNDSLDDDPLEDPQTLADDTPLVSLYNKQQRPHFFQYGTLQNSVETGAELKAKQLLARETAWQEEEEELEGDTSWNQPPPIIVEDRPAPPRHSILRSPPTSVTSQPPGSESSPSESGDKKNVSFDDTISEVAFVCESDSLSEEEYWHDYDESSTVF